MFKNDGIQLRNVQNASTKILRFILMHLRTHSFEDRTANSKWLPAVDNSLCKCRTNRSHLSKRLIYFFCRYRSSLRIVFYIFHYWYHWVADNTAAISIWLSLVFPFVPAVSARVAPAVTAFGDLIIAGKSNLCRTFSCPCLPSRRQLSRSSKATTSA